MNVLPHPKNEGKKVVKVTMLHVYVRVFVGTIDDYDDIKTSVERMDILASGNNTLLLHETKYD
jgi:hypothetical protein